jgi:hypothetical protein
MNMRTSLYSGFVLAFPMIPPLLTGPHFDKPKRVDREEILVHSPLRGSAERKSPMTSGYSAPAEDPRPEEASADLMMQKASTESDVQVGAFTPAPILPPSAQYQSASRQYQRKEPLLYAAGGLLFPPLVLFLMGGSRKTCAMMLGLWVVSFVLIFALFIGVIGFVAIYVWAVIAGYKEAVRQNEAHGV